MQPVIKTHLDKGSQEQYQLVKFRILVTDYVADRINVVRKKGLGEYHANTM